jgi:putative (di)nucleoside polyphosphate hydrolase
MSGLYRKNVGIIVFNDDGKVLLCERKDTAGGWQFPQGGIDEGETYLETAKREIFEETAITSIKLIAKLDEPIRYDFPGYILNKNNFKHIGQEMNWVLYKFVGDDEEINLKTKIPEFKNYKWVDIDEAPEKVVDFKKDVYKKVVKYFKPFIRV